MTTTIREDSKSEKDIGKANNGHTALVAKMSLKRFDMAFRQLEKVAIPVHLDLLKKHQNNLARYRALNEWDNVHKEQVNASRTVQQLTADIWEMERLRNQVKDEDVPEADKKINPLKDQTLDYIHEFLSENDEVGNPATLIRQRECESDENDKIIGERKENNFITMQEQEQQQQEKKQIGINKTENSSNIELSSSWKILYNQLLDLNKLIRSFSQTVQEQQPLVDNIHDNLSKTADNVEEGSKFLGKASKLKTAMYPVAGALIGCCAGPVGVFFGIKVGLAAALGGSALGFVGGKYLKSRNEGVTNTAELELQQISKSKQERKSSPSGIVTLDN